MSTNLCVGQKASFRKTITDADILLFSAISGDLNPIHIDDVFSITTKFRRRIVHGMLTASLLSAVMGTKLPGPGAIYLSQTLKFLKPVYVNETISAEVEIIEITEKPPRIRLITRCINQDNECVLEGEALVKP
jgi:3-hydroxybutyryl-CoA dehydratase